MPVPPRSARPPPRLLGLGTRGGLTAVAVAALSAPFFPLCAFLEMNISKRKKFGRAARGAARDARDLSSNTYFVLACDFGGLFFFFGLTKGKGPSRGGAGTEATAANKKEYKHSALLERTETKRSEEREREEGKTRQPRRGQGGTLAMASTVDPRARVRVSPALQRGPDVAPLAAWPEAGRGPTGFRTIPPLLAALGAVDGPCWRPTRPPRSSRPGAAGAERRPSQDVVAQATRFRLDYWI